MCIAYLRQQIKGHLRVDFPFFRLKEHRKYRSVMVTILGGFIEVTSIEVNNINNIKPRYNQEDKSLWKCFCCQHILKIENR